MSTTAEVTAGIAALKAAVDQMLQAKGAQWEEMFIPESAYDNGVADVINAADASKDQSPTGRQSAGQTALRAALNSTGQGAQVTNAECATCATAILKAVAAIREAETPKEPAT
jgi:hypothetical protein